MALTRSLIYHACRIVPQGDLSVSERQQLHGRSLESRSLDYGEVYTCPICRHGQLTAMTLMDAFACNFCRHIFAANLSEQSIRVVDSSQPTVWRWTGRSWQSAYYTNADVSVTLWSLGLLVVTLPPLIVWLSFYTFPPLVDSPLAWLPQAWFYLTLLSHLLIMSWLLVEHYQLSFYLVWKLQLQAMLGRR